ncbi:hypothetical protein RI065_06495 [Mycoplasmatota bacterium zrk1]
MSKKILLIVEGTDLEPDLIEVIANAFEQENKYNVVSVGTNLEAFINICDKYSDSLDEVEILDVLKEYEVNKSNPNSNNIRRLSEKYYLKYLIFDREPHDENISEDLITNLRQIFNDEYDNGIIFINYPMAEAIYDINDIALNKLLNKTVKIDNIKDNNYKNRVNRFNEIGFLRKVYENKRAITKFSSIKHWTNDFIDKMTLIHFLKLLTLNKISMSRYKEENIDLFELLNALYDLQEKRIKEDGEVYVLSTIPINFVLERKSYVIDIYNRYENTFDKLFSKR